MERSELVRAARTSCALDALVNEKELGALAYSTKGPRQCHQDIVTSVIAGNTLHTAHQVPVAASASEKRPRDEDLVRLARALFFEFYLID